MAAATERILARLREVGFETRLGGPRPFGEELPLVRGVAWEKRTAQLALIAEAEGSAEDTVWRQLLFAGSGIRHQLAGDHPSAYGTPVILAVVDGKGERQIRRLTESLARDYALFNRVDINLVRASDLGDPDVLDDALAPLLPRCRSLLGKEISKEEVQKFWEELRGEVEKAAEGLDDAFASLRTAAGREGAEALIGNSAESEELPSPIPLHELSIRHFRSIESMELSLCDVNIVHGPNGGGKTSLVEAMELAWAGTSQRRPWEVRASEYEKHLPSNGNGSFSVRADGRTVETIRERPEAELSRCVLTHEAMSALASEDPAERFKGLLGVTGLEVPDLDARTREVVRSAKAQADRALGEAGIAPLARADSRGLDHLRAALRSSFLRQFAELPELAILEKTLSSVAGGAYEMRQWPAEKPLRALLERADSGVAEAAEEQVGEAVVGAVLDEAAAAVETLLAARLEAAAAARRLAEAIERSARAQADEAADTGREQGEAAIGVELAARWLNHARGLRQAAERFRADAGEIEDNEWARRLTGYAEGLESAAALAPEAELEPLSAPRRRPVAPATGVDDELYSAAGFSRAPADPNAVAGPLRELAETLQAHADGLRAIGQGLKEHPARRFGAHREALMKALCHFELAKSLRRGGPILETSERIVSELLEGRLAPVVRELVGAIVRFEWYFKPLQMSSEKKAIVLGGLATDRADLDARLVLNSAEKTVLGVAWFLGLHMLQPKERRRVLVLDDPTSGFDAANQAGFASTLRALVRLLEPEQVVVSTHDDAVAAVLAEELSVVGEWPRSVARLRLQRGGDDFSEVSVEVSEQGREVEPESERLGLLADPPAG